MKCEHKAIRCTNGVFYCLECGEMIDPPVVEKPVETANNGDSERPKRKAKKGAEK